MIRLHTINEAAQILAVSTNRVAALVRQGQLPAERLGRQWVIRPEDLEAFAAQPRKGGWPKGKPAGPEAAHKAWQTRRVREAQEQAQRQARSAAAQRAWVTRRERAASARQGAPA